VPKSLYTSAESPVRAASHAKMSKKLWHRGYHLSHRSGVDPDVDNLRPTFGLPGASFTTTTMSTIRATAPAYSPQSTHNPTHLARWGYLGLSPMSTAPNTVARISLKFLLRRRHLGTYRFTERRTGLRPVMSPRSISFQVELESSTVVHRQPLRSSYASGRRVVRHRETAG
jgi:hypothetical protein